ncbi:MAG: hypothetical protein IRY94_00205 [Rhodospirillaceae bacterium]|nr:hypothetical protein [Rhodospirillaceae bacterium]
MAATVERNTRALKTLVIAMGALIVLGTSVVIVTVANRLSRPAGTPAAAGAAPPAAFGPVEVPLPARCRVAAAVPGDGRLVLRLAGNAEECRRILVLDLASGRLLGRLDLIAPAAAEGAGADGASAE